MNKISALESYKITVVLEDFCQKLSYLDLLKANMGDEMAEQMSEEITKAMEEQRSLETMYGQLVTKRGQLKGLSHKKELAETIEQINQVSQKLRVSTRKLCRQLKDNPDVGGNQKLIKVYKTELCNVSEDMMKFMAENQSFSDFKQFVDKATAKHEEFDKLKSEEQTLNTEIKKISEELKKKQDSFAKEAQESSDDIQKLKKQVNECKTESELQIQYKLSEIAGKLQCQQRLYSMKEEALRNQINELKSQLDTEKLVSKRITHFVKKKKELLEKEAEDRDQMRDAMLNQLNVAKEDIQAKKDEADKEIQTMQGLCEEEEQDRKLRELKDQEAADLEKKKVQEKMDMDAAAKYVQRKWVWYQTEGKLLAKKKKGKKGGKKKKK